MHQDLQTINTHRLCCRAVSESAAALPALVVEGRKSRSITPDKREELHMWPFKEGELISSEDIEMNQFWLQTESECRSRARQSS